MLSIARARTISPRQRPARNRKIRTARQRRRLRARRKTDCATPRPSSSLSARSRSTSRRATYRVIASTMAGTSWIPPALRGRSAYPARNGIAACRDPSRHGRPRRSRALARRPCSHRGRTARRRRDFLEQGSSASLSNSSRATSASRRSTTTPERSAASMRASRTASFSGFSGHAGIDVVFLAFPHTPNLATPRPQARKKALVFKKFDGIATSGGVTPYVPRPAQALLRSAARPYSAPIQP